jgi:hypothetical protein
VHAPVKIECVFPKLWFKVRALQHGAVNTSGKAGTHILHLPLGDDSSPSGDSAVSL